MRTTITLNDKVYKALRLRAAESGESISTMVEDAIKYQVLEDLEDIRTLRKRKDEPAVDFKTFVAELKADGLL